MITIGKPYEKDEGRYEKEDEYYLIGDLLYSSSIEERGER